MGRPAIYVKSLPINVRSIVPVPPMLFEPVKIDTDSVDNLSVRRVIGTGPVVLAGATNGCWFRLLKMVFRR